MAKRISVFQLGGGKPKPNMNLQKAVYILVICGLSFFLISRIFGISLSSTLKNYSQRTYALVRSGSTSPPSFPGALSPAPSSHIPYNWHECIHSGQAATSPASPNFTEAYAFLITKESNIYFLFQGAVLMKQLRKLDPHKDMVVMYIDTVSERHLHLMFSFLNMDRVYFERVHDLHVDPRGKRQKKQIERWSGMFAKLSVWSLTRYERVLYLDMDMVLTSPHFLRVWDECRGEDIWADAGTISGGSANGKQRSTVVDLCMGIDLWKGLYYEGTKVVAHNAGMMLVTPDADVFAYIQQKVWSGWYTDRVLQEQTFLNYLCSEDAKW
eukprot:Nk52_evm2s237 gene=Nk52_evmTU2s237